MDIERFNKKFNFIKNELDSKSICFAHTESRLPNDDLLPRYALNTSLVITTDRLIVDGKPPFPEDRIMNEKDLVFFLLELARKAEEHAEETS